MSQTTSAVALTLSTRALEQGVIRLLCGSTGCTTHANATHLPGISRLVRHVMEDHAVHTSILAEKPVMFAPGYALASALGLGPSTEKERRWRDNPKERAALILERMLEATKTHNDQIAALLSELAETQGDQT